MKASSVLAPALSLLLVALLALYVPLKVIEGVSAKTLDPLFGGIIVVVSIVAGATLGFFALVFTVVVPLAESENHDKKVYALKIREVEEKLAIYRARQRAMLEELDEIKKQLEEIRDILKEGMGV
ncbi:hypothetical protein IG193_03375 [Infirmifilum lucidum]|uniref:Uncharacterized protein n=1 Tax=Infirmifilum lucidum TaxID=2776706 RepID=A0A7L9FKN9_9CREN|nr:hypothetical protein [Infirmifilum lucidum]QOJ79514.1 hypothetical protein IG193_03375 [Infirmifilum lucidum]